MTAVHYRIVPDDLHAHLFAVSCTVVQPQAQGQVVFLPVWIPGSYLVREFAKHIVDIEARDADGAVALEKIDKTTWRCAPARGALEIRYRVYAWDLSVRGAYLDATRGFFNGTSVFLCVQGCESQACTVDIFAPEGVGAWRVATAMTRDGAAPHGFGRYRAENYAELIDHPVELGAFDAIAFDAGGVPHTFVLSGRHRADLPRIQRDLQILCNHHIEFFGAPAPMSHYVFLVHAVGEGYGGLEHRASTALLCSRNQLPPAHEKGVSEGYREFLGLCSHEYFHAWNVKRIKPAAFAPYDLTREVYTRQLWAFEGITSYYDDLALVRCGLISAKDYLTTLAQTVTRVLRTPGRIRQSIADSSFDAWTKFYRPDENAPNALVSYYTKGALVALALDLHLRAASAGRVSLDTAMRVLWQRYGQTEVGVPEGAIERVLEEISGQDLTEFFARYVYGTEDPPLAELLQYVGIEWRVRSAESDSDKGGNWRDMQPPQRLSLGIKLADGSEPRLAQVFAGGAAHAAGLAAGDVLLACDGIRLTRANLDAILARYVAGTAVSLHVFRRDELHEFRLTLAAAAADTCDLRCAADAGDEAVAARQLWLGTQAF